MKESLMLRVEERDERAFDAPAILLDLTPDPLWLVDTAGNVTTFNAAFDRWWHALTGLEAAAGMRFELSNQPSVREILARVLAGRTVLSDLRVVIWGTERTFTVHAQPVSNGSSIAAAAFLAREVTHQMTQPHEAALELALVHLFSGEEPLTALMTKTLEFLCVSEGWDAAVVWSIEGEELRPWAMWFTTPEMSEKLSPRVGGLHFSMGHGVPGRTWAAGEVVWIADVFDESTLQRGELFAAAGLHSIVGAPLTDSGRTTGVLEFFTRAVRPVSERTKRALIRTGAVLGRLIERRRLLELVERRGAEWMSTFDSIDAPIFLLSDDGVVARVNHAAREFVGGAFDDILGRSIRSLGDDEPWTTLADTAQAVRDTGMSCTAQITTGERTWEAAASVFPAQIADDAKRIVIVMRDLTQLLKLQDSVRRGEQLAALGELVAGVAHEVKNPIFGMKMTLELLDQRVAEPPDPELLAALHKWLERLDNLTENLLEYGRTWNVNLEPGEVRGVLRQAIDTYGPRAVNADVQLEFESAESSATVLMDSRRLVHVFENLIANALHFSPRGSRITIIESVDEEGVEYAVRDRGPGFAIADLPRIFQPFFTKRRGGTGLGLSIVQRIVEEHGGTISAGNHEQGGAVVRLRLPLYRV